MAFITGYFGPFGCGKTSAGAQKGVVLRLLKA
jgi:hypothetical protein